MKHTLRTPLLLILTAAVLIGLALLAGAPAPAHLPAHLAALNLHDPGGLGLLAVGATQSKFFRIATEGATTDGRTIARDWIDQMAKNFNRAKYGARVWLEHYRGIAPDGLFKAYGDVIAVEARDVEDGKRALFAQIQPLPELVAMNKAGQKIYTSVEIDPKFAGSNEAYMVGLGVTDSPASLGTEVLQFAAQHPGASPFAKRKTNPDTVFSAAVETALEFEEAPAPADDKGGNFTETIRNAVANMFKKRTDGDDARFSAVQAGIESMAQAISDRAAAYDKQFAALQAAHDKASADQSALQAKFNELVARLDKEPANHSQRPPATGGAGSVLTDC